MKGLLLCISIPVAFSLLHLSVVLLFISRKNASSKPDLKHLSRASKAASTNPTHPKINFCIAVHSLNILNGSAQREGSFLCQEFLPGIDVFPVDLYTICLVGTKNHGSVIKLQKLTSERFKIWAQRPEVRQEINQAIFSGSKRIKFVVLYK